MEGPDANTGRYRRTGAYRTTGTAGGTEVSRMKEVRKVHVVDDTDGRLVFDRLLDDGSNVLRFASGFGRVDRAGLRNFGWSVRDGWRKEEAA